ncbi:SRPBCC family protein [Methylosinus sp. Sm6]|uniref:SRPBCC family protein n=1 Tax=Methylosinus sp. Sm6 TaxID=2866948 RepID=UPI001C9A039C|nr:SRPBCC family protein [Methylosinus sp. Sm6]MBY6243584.1 SRPBCC family protein [Methylosinus sp. Sm6]
MLEIIGAGVAVVIAAILLSAARKPDVCRITRSIVIAAPPERIFPLVDDPRATNEWSPFVKDPSIALTYDGPERGVGAACDFAGDSKVGAGRVEIVESLAPSKVVVTLRLDRPMKCRNRVEFTILPQADGSLVTWDMSGPQPFLGKLMTIFFDPEKMVGGSFEKGLADLKTLVEAAREEATQ